MGVIKKQAIQSTFYSYLGVGIGFMNSAILMPLILTTEQVGLLSFLNSYTNIFATLCTFGVPLIALKFYPHFKSDNRDGGFSAFVVIMTLVGLVLGLAVYFLFNNYFISEKNEAKYYAPFVFAFVGLFTFKLIHKNLDAFIKMLYNTVLGAISENFVLKLFVFLALATYWYFNKYDFTYLFSLYAVALSLPGLISLIYLISKGRFWTSLSYFFNKSESIKKVMITVGTFGMLGTIGNIIVLEIDRMMVSNMLGLHENGIYTVAFFFGVFVNIPSRGIRRISGVVISDAWKNKEIETIDEVYKKSCLNQFLIGTYLFLGVWLNIDFVFQFLPEHYAHGRYVILLIGLAQLSDMLTGANAEVIATSKYFKVNTLFVLGLMLLVIVLNYYLIPKYGIDGAALASAIAMITINAVRYLFLWKVFNFQPMNVNILLTAILGGICLFVVELTKGFYTNPFIGILGCGGLLTVIYWLAAYYLSISKDYKSIVNNILKKYLDIDVQN